MGSLLSDAQIKELADQMRRAFAQKPPVAKGANSIKVRTTGGVAEFPMRPTPLVQERDIG